MKLERKKQISELIEETFNNVEKLNDLLKKSDYVLSIVTGKQIGRAHV